MKNSLKMFVHRDTVILGIFSENNRSVFLFNDESFNKKDPNTIKCVKSTFLERMNKWNT